VDALLALVFSIHEPIVALQDRSLLTGLVVVRRHLQLFSSLLLVEAVVVAVVNTTLTETVVVAVLVDCAHQ
jgi:hypothetical protein